MTTRREHRNSKEEALLRLHRRIVRSASEKRACALVARSAVSSFNLTAARVYLHDPHTDSLQLASAVPRKGGVFWESVAQRTFSGRRDVRQLWEEKIDGRRRRRQIVAVPLGAREEKMGVFIVALPTAREPSRVSLETVRILASLLAERLRCFRASRALSASEEALEAILSQVDDVWIGLDREGRIEFFSRYLQEAIGKTHKDLLGTNIRDMYPTPPGYHWPTIWNDLAVEGKTLVFREFEYESPQTKRKVVVDADVRPRRSKDGRIIGILLHVRPVTERRELRLRAQASEERYRQLFEGIHMPVAVFRMPGGELLTWNRRFVDLTGYSDRMLPGKTMADLILPEDLSKVQARYKARAGGREVPDVYEIRGVRADGEVRDLEIYVQLHCEEGGGEGALVAVLDITERKRAEKALRESEEQFKALAEQSPSMIFINKGGRVVYANRMCDEVMGYTNEELTDPEFDFRVLVAPEYRDVAEENYRKHMRGENVPTYEYAVMTKAGERIEALLATKLIEYLGDRALLGIVTDITEVKKIQADLVSRNRQLAALCEVSRTASHTLDLDTILRGSLKSVMGLMSADNGAIYLLSSSGAVFELAAEIGMPEPVRRVSAEIKVGERWIGQAARDSRAVVIEAHDKISGSGDVVPGLEPPKGNRARILLSSGGRTVGVMVLFFPSGRDLSKEETDLLESIGDQVGVSIGNARLYREVREANQTLRQLHEMKDEFVSTVAHELKAPLTSIHGSAELMLLGKEGEISRSQEKFLKLIRSNTERLNRLIHDLLDLSRLDSESEETRPRKAGLQALARDAVEPMRPLALEKGVTLEIGDLTYLPKIKVVSDRIRQVFTNLLSNAIRFTPEGGKIWIEGHISGDEVVVSVNDTGIGVAPEHHERIFQRFQQLGPADVREGGTGLGLTICKKIIETHGGRVWVESKPGAGSRFFFSLPVESTDKREGTN